MKTQTLKSNTKLHISFVQSLAMGFLKEKMQAQGGRPTLVASSILTALFNTGALLLIAREMGAELLGSLAFLLSFIGLLYFISDLGNGLAFENLLASGHKFRDVFRVFMGVKIKLTILMTVASGLLVAAYVFLMAPEGHTALHPVSLFIILGYFITASLAQIWVVGLTVRKKPLLAKSYDLVEGLMKFVMVGGIIFLAIPRGDQDAIFMLTLIYLLAGTMGVMIIRNSARYFKKGENDDEIIVEFHEASRKLVPFIAFGALVLTLDKIMLWYFTDPSFTSPDAAFETLGIYFGAQRITIFIAASAISIQALVGGAVGKYVEKDDSQSVSSTLRVTERYVSLVVLPVTAFYMLFSGDLLNALLGQEFAGAGITVSILAGAGFFTAMASPHLTYLVKAGNVREFTLASGIAFFVLIAGLCLLVPDYIIADPNINGMNGAGIAMLASAISGYAIIRYYTWKILGCKLHPRILAHLFCACLMGAVINFLIWYLDITLELMWLLVFAAIGTFVYGLGLYLSGEMLKRDYTEFKDLTDSEE